ncbi:hypothetical protein VTO42DRAFT_1352 [Malbranchea cinnamomea]
MLLIVLLLSLCSIWIVSAELDPELTGTWVTKSRAVVTGPDFYDPIRDRFKEPLNTGISYSFTDDGYYEEAHYRAVANPTKPSCPQGIMQFQHGTYSIKSNGSLILTPFAEDGRQLISDPCKSNKAEYYRYNQTEIFKRYEVVTDRFHNVRRLNLYQHDGSPMNPMFLAYKPPQMLPTETLNPIAGLTGKSKAKRDGSSYAPLSKPLNLDTYENPMRVLLWWLGLALVSIGSATLLFSN